MTTITGLGLLLLTLTAFSLFSMKTPKGSATMSRAASAAIVTFLVEAVRGHISGDLLHLAFLGETGTVSGDMGGMAVATMVSTGMEMSPMFTVVAGVALRGYGIFPGFIAGYVIGPIAPLIERHLPPGLDSVLGALLIAPITRSITFLVGPVVNTAPAHVDGMTTVATEQSPTLMGPLLGGAIKMIYTSPPSSMAPTAMSEPTGLPMGITAIACLGDSLTNGAIFKAFHFGGNNNVAAIMMEPLTQAHIVTGHPILIYCSNFLRGGSLGTTAIFLGVVNNASGTASLMPGLLAPFALDSSLEVLMALLLAVISGTLAGIMGAIVLKKEYDMKPELSVINPFEEQEHSVGIAR